jgi:hypothetical protein
MDSCRQNLPPVEVLHLFQCESKRFQNIGHWEMPQSEDVWQSQGHSGAYHTSIASNAGLPP